METIKKILADTAYIRTGGSAAEHRCAEYLCGLVGGRIEEFEVPIYTTSKARLIVDGREIPCKGYFNTGSGQVKGPLCYMPLVGEETLEQCAGKIVLMDGPVGAKTYRRLVAHGAAGVLSYLGDVRLPHRDIDQREVRNLEPDELRIPGLLIHAEDAVAMVSGGFREVELLLEQRAEPGSSRNVILELPGERDEWVVLSAHYDSTSLSEGAYDNMSGCIALVKIAEALREVPRRYGLRLIWCGSEERGLLGSRADCAAHQEESAKWLLNINLDMLGSVMGKFVGFSTADEKTKHYLECFGAEQGYPMEVRLGIRSSDSNSYADIEVPAVSFARYAPGNTAAIHERYDTAALVDPRRLAEDIAFITAFTKRLVTAQQFPLDRVICEKVREDLDNYFRRK